ncbi:MAG: hypothetical protein IPM69_18260 [Ignavibacteria bacterium]|nr:hypothetical protein [Ignavibacteria bacterium]
MESKHILRIISTACFLNMFLLLAPVTMHSQWVETKGDISHSLVLTMVVRDSTIFAGTHWHGVFRSSDNGEHWKSINKGLTNTEVNSIVISDTTLFAGTLGGGVCSSTNNGESWTMANNGLTNLYVNALALNGTTLFAGTYGSGVFRSTDNGRNWQAVNTGLTKQQVLSLVVVGKALFAGVGADGIFLSFDNGESWKEVNADLADKPYPGIPYISSLAVVDSTIYAAGMLSGGIFRSTDYGENWKLVTKGLIDTWVESLGGNGTALFAGTKDGGVFRSIDKGENWSHLGLDSTPIKALVVRGTMLFAAPHGKNVWKYENILSAEAPNNSSSIQNQILCHPNPATSTLSIKRNERTFSTHLPVEYSISNILGVKILEFERIDSEFSIPISTLSTGVYSLVGQQGKERNATLFSIIR